MRFSTSSSRSPICDNNSVRAVKQNPCSSRVGKLLVNFLKIGGVAHAEAAAPPYRKRKVVGIDHAEPLRISEYHRRSKYSKLEEDKSVFERAQKGESNCPHVYHT